MEALKEELQRRAIPYRAVPSERPGHLTELAREEAANPEVTSVIAVGGDGTASEVAAGLRNTGKPMGIIPAGTGNDWIKSAGIPASPLKALDLALTGQARLVDTGSINDDFFLNVCGSGFDVTVLDCTEKFKNRFRGLTPYLLGLLQAIFHYRPIHVTVTADSLEETGDYLVCSVANGRYIGGGIPICPAAEIADGKLDLVLIRNVPRWRIPLYLPGLMLSRDLKFRITRHFRAERIRLRGTALRVNVDGEIIPRDEAEFVIHPASLNLICEPGQQEPEQ